MIEDIARIKKEQARLAGLVIIKDVFSKAENIGGVDYTIINDRVIAAVVTCNQEMNPIDKADSIMDANNANYAGYKEASCIMDAIKKLKDKPDILLIRGDGITHMRLGLASYIGIALDMPTIGVSKTAGNGRVIDGLIYVESEIKGYELPTRVGSRPVYISPGHKISITSCPEIVKKSFKWPHKMPEPLALAHKMVNKLKQTLDATVV